MKKKILTSVLLAFPFVLLLAWVLTLSIQVHASREVVIAIQGFDPRDLLSGHYIEYQIDWEKTDCRQFEKNVCPKQDFTARDKSWRWDTHRFYIPERDARELDRLFRQNAADNQFEVVYAYTPGRTPIAKQLLINGEDWRQTIHKN